MTHDPELQDTIDHIGVHRLQQRYADIVNRRAWAEFDEIMRPDVAVRIDRRNAEPLAFDGPQAIATFIRDQIERFDFFEFVILSSAIELAVGGDRDHATARMYMQELRHDRASGQYTDAYGLYQDTYRRIDGRWWFAARWYASLARTGADLAVFPFPDPPPTA